VCIDTFCPENGNPSLSVIQEFWDKHLPKGIDASDAWVPAVSYAIALRDGRADEAAGVIPLPPAEEEHHDDEHQGHDGHIVLLASPGSLPTLVAGSPLNVTSYIAEQDWRRYFNGMSNYDENERIHTWNA
jgi:hypothetical protein